VNTTSQNQKLILASIPELIQKATAAQAKLSAIVTHLEVTQDGVLKSTLPPSKDQPRFTSQFEEYSDLILSTLTEISANLFHATNEINQIQEATKQLVVGVETELNVSPVASMREAINSLDSTMRTRPTTSMPAIKH
jgi:hypothetical protein